MPTVKITPDVDLESIVREGVLRYWRRTNEWPTIRQIARSLGFGVKRITALVYESHEMEILEIGDDGKNNEIMVQHEEVDSVLGSYWNEWQREQLRINQA